jgi:hypothetical protein
MCVVKIWLHIFRYTDDLNFILWYKYIIFMLHVQTNTMLTQAYYGTAENNHSQNNDSLFEHLIYVTYTRYQSNHHYDPYH